MYTPEALQKAMADTVLIVNHKRGFDTFAFRKSFELNSPQNEQQEIMDYLKEHAVKGSPAYQRTKSQIDRQEFLTTDYYVNPYPRKFRGAYAPVVYKTLAGVMWASLQRS